MTQKAANNTCTHAFYPLISRCVRRTSDKLLPDRVNPTIVIARSTKPVQGNNNDEECVSFR